MGLAANDAGNWDDAGIVENPTTLSCGGEDENGDLYVPMPPANSARPIPFSNASGSIWKIVPASKVPAGAKTAPLELNALAYHLDAALVCGRREL